MTSDFRFQPSFQSERSFLLLPEQFLDARQRAVGGCGSRLDRFIGAFKIIPGQRLHVRTKDEVGVALPNFELVLLCRVYRATDDLEDVRGCAAVAVLHADGYADHQRCSQAARRAGRNRGDESSIREVACANLHWFEQTGEGAARADGVDQIALREDHWFARGQIRGYDNQRNLQILIRIPRRWLLARPRRETRQRAMSRKRRLRQVSMIRRRGAPLA